MYHIKIVVDKNPSHLSTIIDEISPDISALKSKLLFILKDEAEFIYLKFKQTEIDQINVFINATPSGLGERLLNIETTILREYSPLIIDRIRSEVQV